MEGVGLTDKGKVRTNNEDAFAVFNKPIGIFPNLYIVADGMGGHNFGEVASSVAIESFLEFAKGKSDAEDCMDLLIEGVSYANLKVNDMSAKEPEYEGMGTTFTACVFKEGRAHIAHVGDSRCYIFKNGLGSLITNDHTYVNEMVKAGQMTKEEAVNHPSRSALIKALGVSRELEVDGYVTELSKGDRILICSDGLTDMVSEDVIFELANSSECLENCAVKLIEKAKENGGVDNITVIIAEAGR